MAFSILEKIENSKYHKREYYQFLLAQIPETELLKVKNSKRLSAEQELRLDIEINKLKSQREMLKAYKLADKLYDDWMNKDPIENSMPFYAGYDYETYSFLYDLDKPKYLANVAYRLETLAYRDKKIDKNPLKSKITFMYEDLENYVWYLEIQTRK